VVKEFWWKAASQRVEFFTGQLGQCDVTTTSPEHCSPMQQSRCHAVIKDWMIRFAAYTAAKTPSAFQLTRQALKLPIPVMGSRPPSNTWFLGLDESNGISIGSAFFAQLTRVTIRQTLTDHATCGICSSRLYLCYACDNFNGNASATATLTTHCRQRPSLFHGISMMDVMMDDDVRWILLNSPPKTCAAAPLSTWCSWRSITIRLSHVQCVTLGRSPTRVTEGCCHYILQSIRNENPTPINWRTTDQSQISPLSQAWQSTWSLIGLPGISRLEDANVMPRAVLGFKKTHVFRFFKT